MVAWVSSLQWFLFTPTLPMGLSLNTQEAMHSDAGRSWLWLSALSTDSTMIERNAGHDAVHTWMTELGLKRISLWASQWAPSQRPMMRLFAGYWWDPASGYYWDANSGLYFDNASKNWLQMDQTTGQMYAVQQYQGQGVSNAAEAALSKLLPTSVHMHKVLCVSACECH